MIRNTISTRALATAALAGVVTFVAIVVTLHVVQHGRITRSARRSASPR